MRCSDLIDLKTTLLAYTRIPRMKLKKKLKIKLIEKKTLDSTIYFLKLNYVEVVLTIQSTWLVKKNNPDNR
jgi:hypothetical protein